MTDETTQVMPDHPELIVLAQDAKEFRSSDFGAYLLNRAAIRAGDAAKLLCDVDPDDRKEIIRLQAEAKLLKFLNEEINQAIHMGNAEYAEYQLKVNGGEE